MLFQIGLLLLLTAINALFVMAEMAIVSVRRSRIEELRDEGDTRAVALLELLDKPESFLSTIQTAITLIGILSGAFGGATLAEELVPYLQSIPYISQHAEVVSFGVVVFGITFLSLILGELVPKRWALSHAESVSLALTPPIKTVMFLAYPIVHLFTHTADFAMRVLRIPRSSEAPVSEEEIKIMLEHGERAGVVEEVEKEMIERVFRLGDRRVDSIMTHRSEIIWLDKDNITSETWKLLAESSHSHFPVCKDSIDEIEGMISIKDIWPQLLENGAIKLDGIIKEPLIVPGAITALRVLERFKESKTHIALVVDEYGSLDGLVTLNDVLQAIVGQLPSHDNEIESQVVERDDGSFLIDGAMSFEEFEDLLNIQELSEEERAHFQTLAGFIISHLGRFPAIGERFEWANHIFEIVDMDGHRVDRVLITPPITSAISGDGED